MKHKRYIILAFFVLSLIFFWKFLFAGRMIYGSDWLLDAYTTRTWTVNQMKVFHHIPLWNPYLYGGIPTASAFGGYPFTLQALLNTFIPTYIIWNWTFIVFTFLAGIGFFLFLKELNMSDTAAFIAGVMYMFSGTIITAAYGGHDGRMISVALTPLIFLFLEKGLKRKSLPYFVFSGGLLGYSFLSGHPQMAYYSGVFLFIYGIFRIFDLRIKGKDLYKVIFFGIITILIAGMIISSTFLPSIANNKYIVRGVKRGYTFATSWSIPTSELFSLFVPNFSGISSNYWGTNYFKLDSQYFGVLFMILASIAIVLNIKSRKVKFFTTTAVLGLLASLGGNTPFYRIVYYLLPYAKKFRAPSLFFFIFLFSVVALSAYGLDYIVKQKIQKKELKLIKNAIISIVSLAFLLLIVFSLFRSPLLNGMVKHFRRILIPAYGITIAQQKIQMLMKNYPLFLKGLVRTFLLLAIYSGIIIVFLHKKIKILAFTALTAVFLLLDLWEVDRYFLKVDNTPYALFTPDKVVNYLKEQPGTFRVFPVMYRKQQDNYLTGFNIENTGGYSPVPLTRYQKFIGAGIGVLFSPQNLIKYRKLNDILNVKYIISIPLPEDTMHYNENIRKQIRYWKGYFSAYKPIRVSMNNMLYENSNALPKVSFFSEYKVVKREKVVPTMIDTAFNPKKYVILEKNPRVPPTKKIVSGNAEIIKFSPNEIKIKTQTNAASILMLAENYHPDWKAYIDKKSTDVFAGDFVNRCVYLPAGVHIVKFIFKPKWFSLSSKLFVLSILWCLFSIIWVGGRIYNGRQN